MSDDEEPCGWPVTDCVFIREWRPIDTVPRRGDFLVADAQTGYIARAFWLDDRLVIVGGQWTPTHWMPLPDPPRARG